MQPHLPLNDPFQPAVVSTGPQFLEALANGNQFICIDDNIELVPSYQGGRVLGVALPLHANKISIWGDCSNEVLDEDGTDSKQCYITFPAGSTPDLEEPVEKEPYNVDEHALVWLSDLVIVNNDAGFNKALDRRGASYVGVDLLVVASHINIRGFNPYNVWSEHASLLCVDCTMADNDLQDPIRFGGINDPAIVLIPLAISKFPIQITLRSTLIFRAATTNSVQIRYSMSERSSISVIDKLFIINQLKNDGPRKVCVDAKPASSVPGGESMSLLVAGGLPLVEACGNASLSQTIVNGVIGSTAARDTMPKLSTEFLSNLVQLDVPGTASLYGELFAAFPTNSQSETMAFPPNSFIRVSTGEALQQAVRDGFTYIEISDHITVSAEASLDASNEAHHVSLTPGADIAIWGACSPSKPRPFTTADVSAIPIADSACFVTGSSLTSLFTGATPPESVTFFSGRHGSDGEAVPRGWFCNLVIKNDDASFGVRALHWSRGYLFIHKVYLQGFTSRALETKGSSVILSDVTFVENSLLAVGSRTSTVGAAVHISLSDDAASMACLIRCSFSSGILNRPESSPIFISYSESAPGDVIAVDIAFSDSAIAADDGEIANMDSRSVCLKTTRGNPVEKRHRLFAGADVPVVYCAVEGDVPIDVFLPESLSSVIGKDILQPEERTWLESLAMANVKPAQTAYHDLYRRTIQPDTISGLPFSTSDAEALEPVRRRPHMHTWLLIAIIICSLVLSACICLTATYFTKRWIKSSRSKKSVHEPRAQWPCLGHPKTSAKIEEQAQDLPPGDATSIAGDVSPKSRILPSSTRDPDAGLVTVVTSGHELESSASKGFPGDLDNGCPDNQFRPRTQPAVDSFDLDTPLRRPADMYSRKTAPQHGSFGDAAYPPSAGLDSNDSRPTWEATNTRTSMPARQTTFSAVAGESVMFSLGFTESQAATVTESLFSPLNKYSDSTRSPNLLNHMSAAMSRSGTAMANDGARFGLPDGFTNNNSLVVSRSLKLQPDTDTFDSAIQQLAEHLDWIYQHRLGLLVGRFYLQGPKFRRHGGQGLVQFATDCSGCHVALKFFISYDTFQQEQKLYSVEHIASVCPDICYIHDSRSALAQHPDIQSLPSFMAFERGEALDEWTHRNAPDRITSFQVVMHVAECLQKLHAANIAHRDLKPGNTLWLPRTNKWTIIDFGCSAQLGDPSPVLFTPKWAAPETISAYMRQDKLMTSDSAVDAWALGVMAWDMLTGTSTFKGSTDDEVFDALIGRVRLPWEAEGNERDRLKLGRMRPKILGLLDRDSTKRPSMAAIVTAITKLFDDDE